MLFCLDGNVCLYLLSYEICVFCCFLDVPYVLMYVLWITSCIFCVEKEKLHVCEQLLCCLVSCFWLVIEALSKSGSDVEELEYCYFHLLCLGPWNKACCGKKKELWRFQFLWNTLSLWSTSRADVHSAHPPFKGPHVTVGLRSWAFEKPNHKCLLAIDLVM